jgi:hypothetical protein
MMDMVLFVVIAGTILLAVGVDVGMILTWMRRRLP